MITDEDAYKIKRFLKKEYQKLFPPGAMNFIHVERERQLKKWGNQHHALPEWYVILGEEFGEVGRDIIENKDTISLSHELAQVAAVAIAILQDIWDEWIE